ncbi:MAG: hypothetical protein LBU36_04385 [Clostridiales bacterium]|jgi:hypothetical protein|nr:hypothetical protein [Clostridiales bacterium]
MGLGLSLDFEKILCLAKDEDAAGEIYAALVELSLKGEIMARVAERAPHDADLIRRLLDLRRVAEEGGDLSPLEAQLDALEAAYPFLFRQKKSLAAEKAGSAVKRRESGVSPNEVIRGLQ